MTTSSHHDLLAAYDATRDLDLDPAPAGVTVQRDGPVLRIIGFSDGGFVGYRTLAGLSGEQVSALIERQIAVFAGRGEQFEWKYHSHDVPADLPERLIAAGFEPQDPESVVVAGTAAIAAAPVTFPPEVTVRTVTAPEDLRRYARLESVVWGDDRGHMADALAAELAAAPDGTAVYLVEAADPTADGVVCAGRMRMERGTPFATLWGGATLPAWRGRGIYRALVGLRARLALARGYQYLQVDASDDSRPILQRMGFQVLTTTTPYIWTP
jgi:GNAT superfamily N-acetyltransferase